MERGEHEKLNKNLNLSWGVFILLKCYCVGHIQGAPFEIQGEGEYLLNQVGEKNFHAPSFWISNGAPV